MGKSGDNTSVTPLSRNPVFWVAMAIVVALAIVAVVFVVKGNVGDSSSNGSHGKKNKVKNKDKDKGKRQQRGRKHDDSGGRHSIVDELTEGGVMDSIVRPDSSTHHTTTPDSDDIVHLRIGKHEVSLSKEEYEEVKKATNAEEMLQRMPPGVQRYILEQAGNQHAPTTNMSSEGPVSAGDRLLSRGRSNLTDAEKTQLAVDKNRSGEIDTRKAFSKSKVMAELEADAQAGESIQKYVMGTPGASSHQPKASDLLRHVGVVGGDKAGQFGQKIDELSTDDLLESAMLSDEEMLNRMGMDDVEMANKRGNSGGARVPSSERMIRHIAGDDSYWDSRDQLKDEAMRNYQSGNFDGPIPEAAMFFADERSQLM